MSDFPRRFIRLLLVSIVIILAVDSWAEAFIVDPYEYNLDLPIGWVPLEIAQDKATFAGPEECTYVQVKVFPGNSFSDGWEISSWASEKLNAGGDEMEYLYSDRHAVFRTLEFLTGDYSFAGYAVCIDGDNYDYFVSAFTTGDTFDQFHDFLLSTLDSFALNREDLKMPGPVSQFYSGSYPEPLPETSYVDFEGRIIPFTFDGNELEASQVLIEREARILTAYTQSGGIEAWKRYYRMLYRDSYSKLDSLWQEFSRGLKLDLSDKRGIAELLLAWVQSFDYSRPGEVSDIYPPLEAAARRSGDCDSRGLLYTILLERAGIDAVLLVSSRYAHSIVGVDVEGTGARYPLGDKGYLVAETSDDVAIGLIAAEMADPAGWIAVDLGSTDYLFE